MSPRAQTLTQTPKAKGPKRFPTGAVRLDLLLEGGFRRGDTSVVYGPAFLGKGNLARNSIGHSLANGVPVIMVTTRLEAARILERLDLGAKEAKLLQIVDTVAASIGCNDVIEGVRVVDGPSDLNGVAAALNEARAQLQGHHDDHLLVIDSLSTLMAHNTSNTVFRFLQAIIGSSRRAGAHSILTLDEPMHTAHEVEAIKHLSTGTIQVRDREGKQQVRILGFELHSHLGWIDCRATDGGFDVVGSFAAGRIR